MSAFELRRTARPAAALHRPVVEQAQPARRISRPRKMLAATDRLLDQVQLLVDDADAGRLGVARAGEADRLRRASRSSPS